MISEKAKKLILNFEGLDQPVKWPGGNSGISMGHGYDLGSVSEEEFEFDWRYYLSADQMERLKKAIGVSGQRAKILAPQFSDIKIRLQDADEVFLEKTLPKFERITKTSFPESEQLPEDAFGALISLVYNRGGDTSNTDRRKEMYEIKRVITYLYGFGKEPSPEDLGSGLQAIADLIRSMKRLWEGQNLGGLLRRRDAEAALVESCIGG